MTGYLRSSVCLESCFHYTIETPQNSHELLTFDGASKDICVLMIKVNKLLSFLGRRMWKNGKHVLHVSIELTKHVEVLENSRKKAVQALTCRLLSCSHSFSHSPKFH